ncbi:MULTISPECIES: D-xylose 1-dehydrogenase [unclassified Haloferax]|uniref:D-xylose 1-dehydrogenase n=1 Tax=unclassified Haloferax TaxID=2625095 RepID=UPI0002B175FA|nr:MULTISPECIES: D-xylose 1-dehydrogenase [unclassified Haloferax]ELZ61858.1 xylose dehydrogenase (NADP) [Haloferax sp. ATCC BAA-646]ELZ61971.1 xylose dehydrogenase (NADP) [Haloferax sp. ATCC BAA-645]ELZ70889.1 xylose dehydrogenase (NADP) [Haloferax sp. ATCC BAA-644]
MKFGILGTAGIGVKSVIPAVQASEHEAAAIASRDEARASAVADELGIPTAYGSYEALLADNSLDAVYIPLPNGLHADWVRAAADRGLHVLCEKPLTASADETAAVFDYCEDAGVTLMEAFMYRFHPLTERAAELVASELGAVVSVTSNFSFRLPDGADDIRIDPDLAGGSVMDVGCYAVSAARLFLGTPDRVYATTTDTRDCGVDTRMSGVLEYDSGATARVESSFDTPETQYYRVQTTDGWLEANPAFNVDPTAAAELTYATDGRVVTETFDPTDSYRREVEAFARAVETGETPRVDREESVSVMRTIDAIYESAETGAAVEVD